MNTLSIKDIQDSKVYVKEGAAKYEHPTIYLDPVISFIEDNKLDCDVEYRGLIGSINEDEESKEENIAYSRINVEFSIKDFSVDKLAANVMGFSFALDKQSPKFLTYSAYRIYKCSNLAIYDDIDSQVFESVNNFKSAHGQFLNYMNGFQNKNRDFIDFHNQLEASGLDVKQVHERLGRLLVDHKKGGYGTTPVVHAAKQLFDKNSMYYPQNEAYNDWLVYNAVTDSISKINGDYSEPTKIAGLTKVFSSFN